LAVLFFSACSSPPVKQGGPSTVKSKSIGAVQLKVEATKLKAFSQPTLAKLNAGDGSTQLVAAHSGSLPKLQLLYNGGKPGPTITMDPGGSHQVNLVNRLTDLSVQDIIAFQPKVTGSNDPQAVKELISKKSSITNLHAHGLHVSPQGRADNVFLKLNSGKKNKYTYPLPSDHAPGTHWYHAHLHGSTALQVQGGMSGALIVKPPGQDLNPPNYRVTEKIIVLQTGATDSPLDPNLKTFTVNGKLKPLVQISSGSVQRFRIDNAGSRNGDYKNVWVSGHDMYLAAFDGVNLTSLPRNNPPLPGYVAYNDKNPLILAPGNRADVYFIPGRTGTHSLMMKSESGLEDLPSPERRVQELMTIQVESPNSSFDSEFGNVMDGAQTGKFLFVLDNHLRQLQTTAPYNPNGRGYLRPIGKADLKRNVTFNVKPGRTMGRNYFINGRDYNEMQNGGMAGSSDYLGRFAGDGGKGPQGQSPWPIREGTVEQWTITNNSTTKHSFHIHVNPFWVRDIVERKDDKPENPLVNVRLTNPNDPRLNRWQDTVNLPPHKGYVVIQHRFTRFEGLFVVHCHILNHQDRGMMINIFIAPNQHQNPQAYFDLQRSTNKRINEEIQDG
jgi:FtsP/CotA-like multicopper oxidase with cupredoxin domain